MYHLYIYIYRYFHPGNSGAWGVPLGTFLHVLAMYYLKRVGREARGTVSYNRNLFIDITDTTLTDSMRKAAYQAM